MAKNETTQAVEQPANYNVDYLECKIDVEPKMKKIPGGGEAIDYYIGEVGRTIKTVAIEPKRAETLNRSWHSRKIIYLKKSDGKPEKIKRIPMEDEGGGCYWDDQYIGKQAQ